MRYYYYCHRHDAVPGIQQQGTQQLLQNVPKEILAQTFPTKDTSGDHLNYGSTMLLTELEWRLDSIRRKIHRVNILERIVDTRVDEVNSQMDQKFEYVSAQLDALKKESSQNFKVLSSTD